MVDERALPVSVETERLVLGSVLLDETLMHNVRPVLSDQDFSVERNRRIWKHVCALYDGGGHVDRVTVFQAMRDAGQAQNDTLSYLASLDEGLPQLPDIGAYVKSLRADAMRRRIMEVADNLAKRAALREDPQALLDAMAGTALDMAQQRDERRGLVSAKELVDRHGIDHLLAPRIERGLPFPWEWMTNSTCGMLPGELWVLAAHTSCGKTSAALQAAVRVAKGGHRTVVFSLEMEAPSLFNRAVWQISRVDAEKGKRGNLNPDEQRLARAAAAKLYEMPIYFSERSSFSALEIHSELRRERARGPIGLVVVDYLQLLSDGGRHDNRAQAVGAAARACKLMAGEFQCPFLLLSQFSRESAKPGKQRRPELTDLKESGDIENHANGVWFLHRESMEDAEMVNVEFILAKQRDGRRNIMREFYFFPRFQRFDAKDTQ